MEKIVDIDYDKLPIEVTKENSGAHLLGLLEMCQETKIVNSGIVKLIKYNGKGYRICVHKMNARFIYDV